MKQLNVEVGKTYITFDETMEVTLGYWKDGIFRRAATDREYWFANGEYWTGNKDKSLEKEKIIAAAVPVATAPKGKIRVILEIDLDTGQSEIVK